MASTSITSWQIEGEKVEAVTNCCFGGSKVTMDGGYSHEFRRQLLLGSKAITNLDSVLKSKDIAWLTKVCIVKPVVMYGCDSWNIKKAECQRNDAFEF